VTAGDWPPVAVPGGGGAQLVDDQAPAPVVDDPVGQALPGHAKRPPAGSGPAEVAPGPGPVAFDVCRAQRCRAKIRWARTDAGESIPVDYSPDPQGRLVRYMRAPGDWRVRVLKKGETPDPTATRWTSHYATCPESTRFRRRDAVPPPAKASPAAPAPVLEVAPPPAPGRLLVVDGNSLAHRAFHALERTGMRTPDGAPVWAVHGFLKMLAGVLERIRPDALLVGFDDRAGSVRRERYPEYKAGRAEKSPELYPQLEQLPGLLADLGVAVLVPAGLEADDVLASAAAAAERAGWKCTVATSDKDALRLVSDRTTVLQVGNGPENTTTVTPAALEAKYGVTVAQYPDFCVLVGDKSDNLPGVRGIGPVKAAQLLTACGTLDAALDDGKPTAAAVEAIGKGYAGKLAGDDAAATIARNRDIMAPVADLVVDVEACRPTAAGGVIARVLRARHLPALIKQLSEVLAAPDVTGARLVPVADPAPARASSPGVVNRRLVAPPVAELAGDQDDAERTCERCGQLGAVRLPVLGAEGETVLLVDGEHLLGDVVLVSAGGVWVAERVSGYAGLRDNRRRLHVCPAYVGTCMTPGHEDRPAHLYPGGKFCDQCNTNRGRKSGNDT
jgi:5'-3' exonuclease